MPVLEGVEHRFVDVRGARLHVAELGAGRPVVLVHGWPQHWWSWRALMPLLADRFRLLALDLRGFGWSQATPRGYRKDELAADVVGALDALGIDRADLVGHDWGGVVGFLACLEHPGRVRRFVAMNTGHVWPRPSASAVPRQLAAIAYQGLLASPGAGRRVNAAPRLVGRVLGAIAARPDAVVPEYHAAVAPRMADPERARAASRLYRTFLLHEYPRWLRGCYAGRRLTTPTLWLHGLRDPVLQPAMFSDVVEHADDVRIEYLAGCGHFPAEECPELVAEHVRAFLS